MKTSIDLPDELYRMIKSRSALEGRTVREVAIELFTGWVGAVRPGIQLRETARSAKRTRSSSAATAWLAEWERLGTALDATAENSLGLVDQLLRDRR